MRIFDDLNRRFSAFNGFASKIEAASSHPWLRLHFPPPAGRAMQGAPQPYLFTILCSLIQCIVGPPEFSRSYCMLTIPLAILHLKKAAGCGII